MLRPDAFGPAPDAGTALLFDILGNPLQAIVLAVACCRYCNVRAYDAERLACYDAAFNRAALDPGAADAAAGAAKLAQDAGAQREKRDRADLAPRERTKRAVSDLFRIDGSTSLDADRQRRHGQPSRQPLGTARDSKLGLFNFRAYKPGLPAAAVLDRQQRRS